MPSQPSRWHPNSASCLDTHPTAHLRMFPFCPRSDAYLAAQQACSWAQGKAVESFQQRDNGELHVGVMGAGHMGSATIRLLLVSWGICVPWK